jgi:hypothetical protein
VDLPVDYGPISKIAAALVAEPDPDACIVTCVRTPLALYFTDMLLVQAPQMLLRTLHC